ncbi:hypothetical protein JB92DRAFT_2827748 [Gautieria morchelliformis]|nr:hypothetical protein JB92DRAFT_2827748 [Gautieria morchelliformis]
MPLHMCPQLLGIFTYVYLASAHGESMWSDLILPEQEFCAISAEILQNSFFWNWKNTLASTPGAVLVLPGYQQGWILTDTRSAPGACMNSNPWTGPLAPSATTSLERRPRVAPPHVHVDSANVHGVQSGDDIQRGQRVGERAGVFVPVLGSWGARTRICGAASGYRCRLRLVAAPPPPPPPLQVLHTDGGRGRGGDEVGVCATARHPDATVMGLS